MRWPLPILIGVVLRAQPSMPIGILRGDVVSRTGTELTVRIASGTIYACFHDAHTYFERDRHPIGATSLAPGDPVEVVADRQTGSTSCYARTVQVMDAHAEKLAASGRPRLSIVESSTESFAPRGDLLFGGIVLRRGATSLILKTHDGEKTLVLRPDTRYRCDGLRTGANALVVNTRVFVRAGRDIDGNVEVYQAAWGAMVPSH